MSDKRILLIIGGGIAAYKSLLLIRELQKRGIGTRCILTNAGAEFVTPLSVSALSGDRVYSQLFNLTDEAEMGHIELSRSADLVVVAPATADLMAKAAQGLANDLASTTLLATDKPVLMAPAMNVRMWQHKATQRNLATLRGDGIHFIGPDEGEMACGEFGPGRMAEPLAIAEAVAGLLHVGAPGRPAYPGDCRPDPGTDRPCPLSFQSFLRPAGLCHRQRLRSARRQRHAGVWPDGIAGSRRHARHSRGNRL